jgi:NET1-associated nuclear protein 1 (U3 small nucleolar RNA-associated protein 17)
MISSMDVNGDTASLKRKREPKDDTLLSQKKHRRRSKLQEDGAAGETSNAEDGKELSNTTLQQTDGDLELPDASSHPPVGALRERLASWKVSKPMGGRMLDIDPIFSPDER